MRSMRSLSSFRLFSPFRMASALGAVLFCLTGQALADTWREGIPMTTARANAGAAMLGDDLYVIGGGSTSGPRSLTEVYDTIGNIWRADVALPVGLEQFGIAATGGKIYVAGGYATGGTRDEPTVEETNGAWIFDLAGGWRSAAPMPEARIGLGLAAVGGKLYAIGGRGVEAGRVFVYDPAADAWTVARENLPAPRSHAAVVARGSDIYVIGGMENGAPTARVDIFDTTRGTWRIGPSLPVAREGHVAAVLDGNIHVTGGESLYPPKTFADHFVLEGDGWHRAASLPTPRHGAVAASAHGKLFVIGGSPGAGVYTVFTQSDVVDIYTTGK